MKLVAITSCSTGIAHTYMAAESLATVAKKLGIDIRVETQGSIGVEHQLTAAEIADADGVIIAASTSVNKDRFFGKRLLDVDVTEAIDHAEQLFDRVTTAPVHEGAQRASSTADSEAAVEPDPAPASGSTASGAKGIYSHLMTGVSYMIPFVVAGGICIALAFAFGGINSEGTLAQAISELGSTSMGLMWPVLAGYAAFSIADRPGLVPGMVAGMLSSGMNAGFLGALLGGFLAGYTVLAMKRWIKLPSVFSGLMPILIIPLISTLFVGLVMKFVIGTPITAINEGLTAWLNGLTGVNSVLLGLILGAMMAVDLAGPVGKAAYFFGVASLTNLTAGQTSPIMAAVMVSGMVPPLAMALSSTVLGKRLYSDDEREAGKSAWVLGLSFISEGAIPFAAADPVRVLASVSVGAAVSGALSMLFNCGLAVPHGGFFVFLIPGAVSNVLMYIVALAAGTIVSGLLVTVVKRARFTGGAV